MRQRNETITITLHWQGAGGEQTANVVCEDGPPAELIPLLLHGCGLGADGARAYDLRLGSPAGRPLRPGDSAGGQGLRSGAHLWLTEHAVGGARRAVLVFPDGEELLLPRSGVTLTRAWLLHALALLSPPGHARELARLERRESLYRYVSNRPHCTVAPRLPAGLFVSTDRLDVATLLNGVQLVAGTPMRLSDGDQLTLGERGLRLGVAVLGE